MTKIWFLIILKVKLYLDENIRMNNKILLSTDTMVGYGLDMIFEMAKRCEFDGIDLAVSKGFDAWNESYVKSLVKKHQLPVYSIQTSASLNSKEMNKVLDLCEATDCGLVTINPPRFFDFRSYAFISNNIGEYQAQNPALNFSIINPEDNNIFALPIPAYRFSNVMDIIKKYGCALALDVANMDSQELEWTFSNKLDDFSQYLSVVYISDKSRKGEGHLVPGEWILQLPTFIKRLMKSGYQRPFCVKLNLTKDELADADKVELLLTRSREYILKHGE